MEKILKKDIRLAELDEFLSGQFALAVFEFNGACGKSPESAKNINEAVDMLLNESRRVIEESQESINAFLVDDRKERLDGVIDVYWTNTQLSRLFEVFAINFGEKELAKALSACGVDSVNLIRLAGAMAQTAISTAVGDKITGNAIVAGGLRVIKNNAQKYTKSKEVADDWEKHIDKGTQAIKSYEFNGETLYCIKRLSDDYIVKPYNFKAVKLEDLCE